MIRFHPHVDFHINQTHLASRAKDKDIIIHRLILVDYHVQFSSLSRSNASAALT